MPIASWTTTGLVAAVLVTGCGSDGDGGAHGDAPTATAPPTQTAPAGTSTGQQATPTTSTATTGQPPAGTTATEPAAPPATARRRARLVAACRSARRRHPWPARPADPAALKAYATAALPAAQATFQALRRVPDPGSTASGLMTAYGGLVSLYRQMSRGPALRARQIGPALVTVERVVADQAKRARAPACAPLGF